MKKTIAAIYGAVVALLVAVIHDSFLTKQLQWPESAALVGAICIGIFLLIIYELIGGSKAVARKLSPASRVEGAWRINLSTKVRPVSVCKISFTRRDFVYNGYGINPDGTLGSSWTSRDVHYDEDQDELSFTSDATLTETGKRVRNYGYIKFSKNANGKFEYGNGYFVDMADTLSQTHMTLARISDAEFDELVKSTFSRTRDAEAKTAESTVPSGELNSTSGPRTP